MAGSEDITEDVVTLGAGTDWLGSSADVLVASCWFAFIFVVGSAEGAGGSEGTGGCDDAEGAGGAGEGCG